MTNKKIYFQAGSVLEKKTISLSGEGPLQCTSCPPHFMLEEGGLCIECLGSQYYDPPTQLCKACHSSCTACDGPGPFSCIACTYPLRLDKSNKQCVPCCTERTTTGCCNCDNATGEYKYNCLL